MREIKQLISIKDGEEIRASKAIIVILDLNNGREAVHPLTHFINSNWGEKDFGTQQRAAQKVNAFLNYAFFEMHLGDLRDLTKMHGIQFLDNKREKDNCSYDTLKGYDNKIMQLYYWLSNTVGLRGISHSSFKKIKVINFFGTETDALSSFFWPEIIKPKRNRKKPNKLHNFEEHLIMPFIETAMDIAPDIVFGIYCAMLGGIRGSEVCSTYRSGIISHGVSGEFGLTLDIKTNEIYAKGNNNRVKSERKQNVIAIGNTLAVLYIKHLRNYPPPIDGSDALFVNSYGRAMQYQSFLQRFKKVKLEFLNRLSKSQYTSDKTSALFYSSIQWQTHICRGVFSNLIAKNATNILQVALERGDHTLDAALTYMENTEGMRNAIGKELEYLYSDNLEGAI